MPHLRAYSSWKPWSLIAADSRTITGDESLPFLTVKPVLVCPNSISWSEIKFKPWRIPQSNQLCFGWRLSHHPSIGIPWRWSEWEITRALQILIWITEPFNTSIELSALEAFSSRACLSMASAYSRFLQLQEERKDREEISPQEDFFLRD